MKIIHVLHHSLSPFQGQFPDRDILHYDTGIPMLFARETRKRYPEVKLECWRPERTLQNEYRWYDEDYNIGHRVFPSRYVRYNWELSLPMLRSARESTRTGDCAFFIHGSYNLHTYSLARILADAPVILQSHGGLPAIARMQVSQRRWLRPLLLPSALIESQTLNHYRYMFAVNRKEKNIVEKLFPTISVKFSPVSIDFKQFSPGDRETSRTLLGLQQDLQIVLFVGRLAPEKGIHFLLQSAAALAKHFPNFRLYLIGSGPLEQEIRQTAEDLALQENIHLVGYLEHDSLVDWYRAANVVCLPSLFEGFPLALAEAMACGTPVVATHVGGTEDVVQAFQCGDLVPPADPGALTQALSDVLDGAVNSIPDVEHARAILDWSEKLHLASNLFETMTSRAA